MEEIKAKILKTLNERSEQSYREFSQKLSPGVLILGVRLGTLRKISKDLLKNYNYESLLYPFTGSESFEEKFVRAYVIANSAADTQQRLILLNDFIGCLDGWAITDSLCSMLKECKSNQSLYFDFISRLFCDPHPYKVRFAVVMALNYFTDNLYLRKVFCALDRVDTKEYYVHMAVAWAAAECYTKYKEETLSWLKTSKLEKRTFNKALCKICESLIPSKEEKSFIKSLRR